MSVNRKRRGLGAEPGGGVPAFGAVILNSGGAPEVTWGNPVALPCLAPSPEELNQNHWEWAVVSLAFTSFLGDSNTQLGLRTLV